MTNSNDLLQRFVENEKKSKTWTLISVAVFLVLGGIIIYFAYNFKKKSKELDIALQRADSLINVNELNRSSLENATKTADFLKHQNDSLMRRLNPTVMIIDTSAVKKMKYTVYIQYIASYEAESKSVLTILQRNNYTTPGRELMKRPAFLSCVKYFKDDDKAEAQRVANIINRNIDKFKETPIRILRNNINVPDGQLEVWLGEIKRLDTEQLIDKYTQKKANR